MVIHVVQPGETIYSISEYYEIPVDRLILENGITNPENLAIGQTIVIIQPETIHTVQAGDPLESIAEQHNVSPMELLRNNPYLSDRVSMYTGETIVISYQTNKLRTVATSGYTFPYIDKSVLIKTLPFLTYLSIFSYRVTNEGEIVPYADDTELVNLAKTYGVAPLLFVSSISEEGIVSYDLSYEILNDPIIQDRLINNALQILKMKGYYGINVYFRYVNHDNINSIAEYLKRASAAFHEEGFKIFLTITPFTNIYSVNASFERLDYSKLSKVVDGVIFSSYDWARSSGFPNATYPIYAIRELLDYVVSITPSDQILLGIVTHGYNWTLPYLHGISVGTIITNEDAIQIAVYNNVPIQFNEIAQSPYYYFLDSNGIQHIAWFKDARSFDSRARLADEYDLQGLSIWTIMRFNSQLWLIINNLYYIERLLGID